MYLYIGIHLGHDIFFFLAPNLIIQSRLLLFCCCCCCYHFFSFLRYLWKTQANLTLVLLYNSKFSAQCSSILGKKIGTTILLIVLVAKIVKYIIGVKYNFIVNLIIIKIRFWCIFTCLYSFRNIIKEYICCRKTSLEKSNWGKSYELRVLLGNIMHRCWSEEEERWSKREQILESALPSQPGSQITADCSILGVLKIVHVELSHLGILLLGVGGGHCNKLQDIYLMILPFSLSLVKVCCIIFVIPAILTFGRVLQEAGRT